MEKSNFEISQRLKDYKLKSTNQRISIYKAILPLKNHPSAEIVYDFVKTDNPSITLATVYNTLETFAKSGLINKISSSNGKLRYDPNTSQHNHIYCTKTNDIYDFYDSELESIIKDFITSKNIDNFELTDFKVLLKGNKIIENKKITIN